MWLDQRAHPQDAARPGSVTSHRTGPCNASADVQRSRHLHREPALPRSNVSRAEATSVQTFRREAACFDAQETE
jgi:hypothetical protein